MSHFDFNLDDWDKTHVHRLSSKQLNKIMMVWLLTKKNTLYAHRIIHFEILNHFAPKQTNTENSDSCINIRASVTCILHLSCNKMCHLFQCMRFIFQIDLFFACIWISSVLYIYKSRTSAYIYKSLCNTISYG